MADVPTSLYYQGIDLAGMEAALRANYLSTSGWLESAESKLAQRGGRPLPWFTYGAISFLERELHSDLAAFEYGGGQSTLYWAERLRRVASVDHDPEFVAFVQARLPANAELREVAEGAAIPPALAVAAAECPDWPDPPRTTQSFRSGQLNRPFSAYALSVLAYPPGTFDVVIVDGMARILSTWAAIRSFPNNGFIVFDNSDRDFYLPAYEMLADAGYRRLDFRGLGPVNPYEWCTSVFYQPAHFLTGQWFPTPVGSSAGQAAARSPSLGILVIGFNRPYHLQAVLESLRLQGRIGDAHLWIDGCQGRAEYGGATETTVELARRYPVKELREHQNHLGIEKLMLDALEHMSGLYDRILVLEDDCFPVEKGVEAFEAELDRVAGDDQVYSVYGHHFGCEPPDDPDFPRFQGWGWAAHSAQVGRLLPELRRLFMMDEEAYLRMVDRRLTPAIRERLDQTPGRDVLNVLSRFYSWDSATAFLAAERGLTHRRTTRPAVLNNGIVPGIGHFAPGDSRLRAAPFNMVTLDESWALYDRTTPPCAGDAESYGLDGLDRLILEALPSEPGVFVELGAFDGVTQSNSVLLERAGWRGLLIEANPSAYAKCVRARPGLPVEHAACVSPERAGGYTTICDVGLMSMTSGSSMDESARADWLRRGEGFAGRPRQDIDVPARTLSQLLDKHEIAAVDLLLLDVEGAEVDVLKGVDWERHAPSFIVAEDAYSSEVADYLAAHGYTLRKILLERRYTRDCLYAREALAA